MPTNIQKPLKDYLPFKTALQGTPLPALPTVNPDTDPCVAAEITYTKNPDGVYIFANNPEMLRAEDVNICNLRTENMRGRYEFTFEHSNHTNSPFYAGYRLTNNGSTDMVVTVYNIGYQYIGEWLGARSWSDFYNLKFPVPADYYDANGDEEWYYVGQDFLDHTPKLFAPQTITVPAGRYLWVFGGTTKDNFRCLNIGETGDVSVPHGRCMNGVVLFDITQGENITGSLYFYTDAALLDESQPEQGYIVERDGIKYSAQYKGIDDAMGLIEANIGWTVNDKTPAGQLPVTYATQYDVTAREPRAPYAAYDSKEHIINAQMWQTALNPQNSHTAIGTDMSLFKCVTTEGKEVILDNDHADGGGEMGNFGNWMISYQDNFTFANTGSRPRTFSIYKEGAVSGALVVAIRDRDGNVLESYLKCHPIIANKPREGVDESNYVKRGEQYWPIVEGVPYYELVEQRALMTTLTVAPQTVEQITVEYLILGNSNGGIKHWVTVD